MTLVVGISCGKCKMIESLLDKNKIKYHKVVAENNMGYCEKNNIQSLPVLVTNKGDFIRDFNKIREYINNLVIKGFEVK